MSKESWEACHDIFNDQQEAMSGNLRKIKKTPKKKKLKMKGKGNSKKSFIWKYFEALSTTSAKCNICSKEIGRNNSGTSSMRTHMRSAHNVTEPSKDASSIKIKIAEQELSADSEDEKSSEDEPEYKSHSKKSWAWRYFKATSSTSAKCNICKKEIGTKNSGTSGMIKHMINKHKIAEAPIETATEPQSDDEESRAEIKSEEAPQVDLKQRSSYVWRYFQCTSNDNASCNECGKVIGRNNFSTSGMMKHLKTHGIKNSLDDRAKRNFSEPFKKVAQIEFKSVPKPPHFVGYSKENCYVCNVKLGSFKSELSTFTSTTETPLHEILENFTGAELSQTEIDGSSVCQKCFTSLEKYDDLLHQSQEISNNLTALLHKTHSEEVFIKDEPEFEDEVMQESSSQSFRENHPRRSLSESRVYEESDEQMDEDSSDYNNDEPSQSETRADETDKIDKADKMKVYEDIRANGFVECSTCKATFKHSKNYFRHIQIHRLNDESLFCKACTISFKTTSNFQIHLATDHDRETGPFDCPVCQRTYPDRKTLQVHFYIHTRKKNFLCVICGSTYLTKYSLEMHAMTHDDIRPFECTISGCAKRFRTVTQRNIHIRVHTGEKIYECSHCPGRRFAQKWGLDLHVKKQHKNEVTQKETCQICGVKVPSKSKMKTHLKNVHDVAGSEEDQASMNESYF